MRERQPSSAALIDSPRAWVVAFASLFLAAAGSGIYFLVAVGLVPHAAELGVSVGSATAPYGAAMVGMGVGGIAIGWLAERLGSPFWPAVVGCLAVAVGCYGVSIAQRFETIVLLYALFLGLLGNAAFVTPLFANATHWFQRRRGVAVSIVGSGQALGGAVWPVVLDWAITDYGWRATFRGYALFAILAMLPLAWLLRRPTPVGAPASDAPRAVARRGSGDVLGLPENAVLVLLCAAVVGCCTAMSMPLVHLPKYVVERGFTLGQGAYLLSLLMTTSVVSRLAWGFVCDRIGGLPTLLAASATQAAALALLAATSSSGGLHSAAILFGMGFGGILPCYPVILREHFRVEGLGWRVGVIVLFGSIGMAIGPGVAGRVFASHGSYPLGFAAGVAANLVNLGIITFLNLRLLGQRSPRPVPVWESAPGVTRG